MHVRRQVDEQLLLDTEAEEDQIVEKIPARAKLEVSFFLLGGLWLQDPELGHGFAHVSRVGGCWPGDALRDVLLQQVVNSVPSGNRAQQPKNESFLSPVHQ